MMNETWYELEAINNTQKSFYKKAYVQSIEESGKINGRNITTIGKNLYSYNSCVMNIIKQFKDWKVEEIVINFYNGSNYYSKTTTKHKKEFLEQEGILNILDWDEIRNKERIEINLRETEIEIAMK